MLFLVAMATSLSAQMTEISGDRIRAHVKFLSSDLLEGRGVGARGGDLATEYMATQFALIGAKPVGDNGTYFQKVPLVGVDPQPSTQLSGWQAARPSAFHWLDGLRRRQRFSRSPISRFERRAVFVGHGITAPEYHWDDFKGVDVSGKVLVLFTNEPPSDDPKFFDGRALTYYGRWTYKYEEACAPRRSAPSSFTPRPRPATAWDVVRSSWAREDQQVQLAPDAHDLAFAGWVTKEAGEKITATLGKRWMSC